MKLTLVKMRWINYAQLIQGLSLNEFSKRTNGSKEANASGRG